MMLHTNSVKGW